MKVLVVTGATGGHIFPALSFIDTLKSKYRNIEVFLVLSKRSLKNNISIGDCKVGYLSICPLSLRFNFENFVAIINFIKGAFESLFILLEFRPDTVVGFGSLDSVPIVLFAWVFRMKTLIHEQNVIPGRANRLLAKFAEKTAISFIETKNYLKLSQERIIFTGNPVRHELKMFDISRALDFFGFKKDRFTILVMGGSLGSHRINECFLNAVSGMPDKSRLQVIHIAGVRDYGLLEGSYKDLEVKVKLFAFLKEMQYAYCISDLVICRAGATTIAELLYFKLPAIIIPYPFAYRHQLANASLLTKEGTAIIINDDDLDSGLLRENIESLIQHPEKLEDMRSGYGGALNMPADELLVNEAMS
jgi:UDP-N-acetylglucosamine--N-acetylmuramyl-(pentapeptide) pyrophosphoryl-undecaprenol N-acetylglucosamine transferase